MVDVAALIPKPELVTAEAPQNRLGGDAFARTPQAGIGKGLGDLGTGVEAVASTFAKQAAVHDAQQPDAVTRDENGSIQIQPASPFILGQAGEDYRRLFSTSALARVRTMMDSDFADIHRKFAGDAAGFEAEANKYIETFAGKNPGTLGEMAVGYGRQQVGQHRDNIVNNVSTTDVQASANAVDARIKYIESQASGIAAQGGTGSTEFGLLQAERDHLLSEKTGNPLSGYNADAKKVDDDIFNNKLALSAASGNARRMFQQSGNLAAAQEQFRKDVDALPVSEEQKLRYMGEINSHLQGANAVRQQEHQEWSDRGTSLITESKATGKVDPQRFEDMARQLDSRRLYAKAALVRTQAIEQDLLPIITNGSAADAAATMQKVLAMNQQRATASPVRLSAADRDLAIRTIAGEAGGEALQGQIGVAHVLKTRLTSGGFGSSLPDVVYGPGGASAPFKPFSVWNPGDPAGNVARGLSVTSPTYMQIGRIVDDVMAGKIADTTGGADHYYNPRAARPSWGPQLAALNDVTIGNHRFVGGTGSPGEMDAAKGAAFNTLIKETATAYNAHAQKLWSGMKATLDDSTKGIPSQQEFAELRTMAPYISDQNLKTEIGERVGQFAASDKMGKLPLAQQQDVAAAGNLLAQTGQLDAIERKTVGALSDEVKHKTSLAQNDAVTYAQRYIPAAAATSLPQLAPLDPSDPQAFAAGLQARQAWKNAAMQMEPQAANTVLRMADRDGLVNTLPQMTAPQVANVLSGLAGLKPEEIATEMSDSKLNAAVLGVTRSGDPAKMNAGYSFLDAIYRKNPVAFETQFPGALRDVRAWQALGSYLPPDEVAKRMLRANDPNEVSARKRLEEQADTELAKTDATTVRKKFSGWMPWNWTSDPTSAEPGLTAEALRADYVTAYKDMFAQTGDKNQADTYAIEKMNNKWGVSGVNGGRVMTHPPEKYYPQVDGSHGWLQRQLSEDVQKIAGDQGVEAWTEAGTTTIATTPAQQRAQNIARSYALVPDQTTQVDIAAGRFPSYQVVAQGEDGRMHLIEQSPGRPFRFYGDPRAAQEEARGSFSRARDRAATYRGAMAAPDPGTGVYGGM